MRTKLLTLFSVLLLSVQVFAYDFESGGLYYNILDANSVEVTTYSYNASSPTEAISIPTTVTHNGKQYTVTAVGKKAFQGYGLLSSISFGSGVTTIGDSAFYDCSIVSLDIPSNITIIGKGAFIPTEYSTSRTLTSVVFHEGLKRIEDHAFAGNLGLTSITLPKTLEYLGNWAFYGAELESITIPENVTHYGLNVFSDYYSETLKSVTWNAKKCITMQPEDYWGDHYFPTSVTSFTFGENVTYIPDNLCRDLSNLTSIQLPEKLDSIGEQAFNGCEGITSLTIPANVKSIGSGAFAGYETNLTSVTWKAKDCKLDPYGSIFAAKADSTLTEFIFTEGVEVIPTNLCYELRALTSITIPSSVIRIGESAFQYCASLSTLKLGTNVQHIDESAFQNCRNLESITLPNSIKTLGRYAFYGCKSATIHIPANLTSIGIGALASYGLSTITVDNANSMFIVKDNCLIAPSTRTLVLGCKNSIIPADGSVTSIGGFAFGGSTLTTITIPQTITSIGYGAFTDSDLAEIVIPNNVTLIDSLAFQGCYNLQKVTLPSTITRLPYCVFTYCPKLQNITLPESITAIETYALSQCGFQSLDLPESVTEIDMYAFYGNQDLESIILPSKLDSIGSAAFGFCPKLSTISYRATNPIAINYEELFGRYEAVPAAEATLIVPCGYVETYKKTEGWNTFGIIKEGLLVDFSVISADESKGLAVILQKPTCDQDAIIQAVPKSGYKFVSWNDDNTENPRIVTVTEDVQYVATFASINNAIENIIVNNTFSVRKIFENGTIYIVKPNGERYTIDGRKME